MKRLILLSLLLVTALLYQSCDRARYHVFRSYITEYCYSEDIDLDTTKAGNIIIRSNGVINRYSWKDKGEEKKKYEEFCRNHNDLTYNKKREYRHSPEWGVCSAVDFIEIDIVSNKDFDSEHPAGTSLKDIVRFVSVPPKKFIDSGYKETFNWRRNRPEIFKKDSMVLSLFQREAENYFPINRLLKDMGRDEMQMLPANTHGILFFDKKPTADKEHKLKVTIYIGNNRKLVNYITKKFK